MSGRLEGKVALVTGSTSGIGRATAKLFAEEGSKVVVTGRRRNLGEELVGEIESAGGIAVYYEADLSQSQKTRDLVRFTVDTYDRIDVLVNNAMSHIVPWGGAQESGLLNTSDADWDTMMAVGLKSPFIACQEAIPHMVRQGGGCIINISSIRGLVAQRKGGAYDVAKAGILNLSRQVTVDFGQHGIRANTISPGWIPSDETHRQIEEDPSSMGSKLTVQPVRRPGRYIDIAYAALFLASDESTFVAGANLLIDGGLLAQSGFDIYDTTLEAERQSRT